MIHATALILFCCLAVPAEVELDAERILFGDLVDLPDGDARAGFDLGYAPAPGLARRFHDYELMGKLRGAGFRTDDLRLPDSVLVRRRSRALDAAQLRPAVLEALKLRFPEARIEVFELTVPPVEVATGPIDVSVELPSSFRSGSPASVRIEVQSAGVARTTFARLRAGIETLQPVARRAIAAHAMLGPEDVEWTYAPLTSGTAPLAPEALEHRRATRDIEAGQVLTVGLLYSPVLVRRGEAVTVEARAGAILVSAVMEARESGEYGETIVLRHLDGQGQVSARVVAPGRVEALMGGLR